MVTGTEVTQGTNRKLETLLGSMLAASAESLQQLVGRPVAARARRCQAIAPQALLGRLDGQHAIVRGVLDGPEAGDVVRCVIAARDATTLAGYTMMTPEETIAERRATGTLAGEELESFAEVANVLCSSFDGALRGALPDAGVLRAKDHGVLDRGGDALDRLGTEELVALEFTLTLGGHPESRGWILLERRTAERWNGGALAPFAADAGAPGDAAHADCEENREIEPVPIRGQLTAYVVDPDVFLRLRSSCCRVGLAIDRRGRVEVPNPGEHKEGIVLMDVPSGDTRRFDWCKRLKQHHPEVKVALLIHHPSRSRVTQGFLAKADAIMGWPVTEARLAEKLSSLLEPAEPQASA